MYKVLISDDNTITKKSIELTIDWPKLNCKVIADADNGTLAFEKAKKYVPDLIITDIRMPGLDGLKLTEKIKNLYPWIKVIIITGYNEFSYAKEALRLGAFDIILKPVNNNELTAAIKKAVDLLDAEKKARAEKENMLSEIAATKSQVQAKYIIDIIENSDTPEAFLKTQKKFFIFSVKDTSGGKVSFDIPKRQIESLKRTFDFEFISFVLNNLFTAVVLDSKGSALKDCDIIKICGCFKDVKGSENGGDFLVGASNIYTKFDKLKAAYTQSTDALDRNFYFPGKKIIYAHENKPAGILNDYLLMNKISAAIKSTDSDKFNAALNEITVTISADMPPSEHVKNFLANICFFALDYFNNVNGSRLSNYESRAEIDANLRNIDSFADAVSYVKNMTCSLMNDTGSYETTDYSKVTFQVIDYLNNHYDKKVSLQEISDLVALTPSYLSRVIKKDTGKSFVDLFNSIKIDIAEKLLKQSNLKVYEVANRIGIDNYSYFYQLFKKYTGISPTEYYNNHGFTA